LIRSESNQPRPATVEPDRPFSEPWQAAVFALTVHLNEVGVFTWTEWAEVFGRQLRHPDAADDDGSDYYHRWSAALERLLEQKGVMSTEALDMTAAAWERAANATPHGQPIDLANDPLGNDEPATGRRSRVQRRTDLL